VELGFNIKIKNFNVENDLIKAAIRCGLRKYVFEECCMKHSLQWQIVAVSQVL